MKKVIAIVLVVIIALGMFAAVACSQKSDDFKERDLVYVNETYGSHWSEIQAGLNADYGDQGWWTVEEKWDTIWVCLYKDSEWARMNKDGYYR